MSGPNVYDVTLRLTDIGELFAPPDVSPLSPQFRTHGNAPALENIAEALRADPGLDAVRATIVLPADAARRDLTEDTRRAVARYCRARLRHVRDRVQGLRWRGSRGFVRGGVLLVLLGGAGKWLEAVRDLPLQIVGQGLLIAGTIVLEMALWDYTVRAWEQRLHARVYRKVMDMDLTIEADDEVSDG